MKNITKTKKQTATKEPAPEINSTAVLPYVKGLSEALRRCLQQQGIRTVFRSNTTLRSRLVRPKDTVDPAKQDGVVYKIPCECGKNILERREDLCMNGLKNTIETYGLLGPNPPPFQNTAMGRATIRSGMRLSLLTETHNIPPWQHQQG